MGSTASLRPPEASDSPRCVLRWMSTQSVSDRRPHTGAYTHAPRGPSQSQRTRREYSESPAAKRLRRKASEARSFPAGLLSASTPLPRSTASERGAGAHSELKGQQSHLWVGTSRAPAPKGCTGPAGLARGPPSPARTHSSFALSSTCRAASPPGLRLPLVYFSFTKHSKLLQSLL